MTWAQPVAAVKKAALTMGERRDFEMTQADLDGILAKINSARSTPLIRHPLRPDPLHSGSRERRMGGARRTHGGFDAMTVQRGRSRSPPAAEVTALQLEASA